MGVAGVGWGSGLGRGVVAGAEEQKNSGDAVSRYYCFRCHQYCPADTRDLTLDRAGAVGFPWRNLLRVALHLHVAAVLQIQHPISNPVGDYFELLPADFALQEAP